jgi:hypothetical protein
MASVPNYVGIGGALCWAGGDTIYAFRGWLTNNLYKYSIAANSWLTGTSLPAVPGYGASMAWAGGDTIYAFKGGGTREFWAYSLIGKNWVTKAGPPEPVADGGALVWNRDIGSAARLWAVAGAQTSNCWLYNVATGTWTALESAPGQVGGAREGASATFDSRGSRRHLYIISRLSSYTFWRYGDRLRLGLPLDESFEGDYFPPAGWTMKRLNGVPACTRWQSGTYPTAVPYHGAWMVACSLYSRAAGDRSRLRTPQIDAGPSPTTAKLTFRMYQTSDGGTGDTLFVEYSTDGTNYQTKASFDRRSSVGWNEKNVIIGTDLRDTFYVAFHAKSGTGSSYNIYLDSVRIYEVLYPDVGASAITSPRDTVNSGTLVTPQAIVKNFGNTTATFLTHFKIGAVYADSQLITSLAPQDSAIVTFGIWTAVAGSFATKCSTTLSGDMTPANNRCVGSVFVAFPDVGASRIITPSGIVDSGSVLTPQAVARNFGNISVSFPVILRIGSDYTATAPVANLGPGDSTVVSFAAWTAGPRGTHPTKCSTALAEDRNPNNDASLGSVSVRVRDVGTVRIDAPTGTIDSGMVVQPEALVRNFGTTTEAFSATFRIGGFYANTQNIANIAPGDTRVVSFTGWTAVQVGTHTTKCTTFLAGDMNPTNNLARDSVEVAGGGVEIAEPPSVQPLPSVFALEGSMPSPFRSQTAIRYALPKDCMVSLEIYDASGLLVRSLKSGGDRIGFHRVVWNGCDARGRKAPNGVYIYRLRASEFSATGKTMKVE